MAAVAVINHLRAWRDCGHGRPGWHSHLYEDDLEALAEALHSRFADSDVAQVWPKPPGDLRELRS